MKKGKLTGADFLLLLLYLDKQSPIISALRLIKMIFLFNQEIMPIIEGKGLEIEKDKLAQFIPFNFGPFSKDVYEQIELFKNIKFISVSDLNSKEEMEDFDVFVENLDAQEIDRKPENSDKEYLEFLEENQELQRFDERKTYKYKIEKLGIEYVEQKIFGDLNKEIVDLLESFKRKINKLTVKQILYYVYSKYPEFTENSKIKNEVLGK